MYTPKNEILGTPLKMTTLAYNVRRSGVPAYTSTSLIEYTPAFQIITFVRHSATEPAVDFCANHVESQHHQCGIHYL